MQFLYECPNCQKQIEVRGVCGRPPETPQHCERPMRRVWSSTNINYTGYGTRYKSAITNYQLKHL